MAYFGPTRLKIIFCTLTSLIIISLATFMVMTVSDGPFDNFSWVLKTFVTLFPLGVLVFLPFWAGGWGVVYVLWSIFQKK